MRAPVIAIGLVAGILTAHELISPAVMLPETRRVETINRLADASPPSATDKLRGAIINEVQALAPMTLEQCIAMAENQGNEALAAEMRFHGSCSWNIPVSNPYRIEDVPGLARSTTISVPRTPTPMCKE